MQLVLMCLQPKENISPEIHSYSTQIFRVESGNGIAVIENEEHEIYEGDIVVIPLNTQHDIYNNSKTKDLKLSTIYSPPLHNYDEEVKIKYMD